SDRLGLVSKAAASVKLAAASLEGNGTNAKCLMKPDSFKTHFTMKNFFTLTLRQSSRIHSVLAAKNFLAVAVRPVSEAVTRPVLISKRWLYVYAIIGFGWFSASPVLFAAGSMLKTLPDHIPAVVAHLSAIGILPTTNRLNLAIGLPLRDAQGLDDFLAQLSDPANPNYRHYVTPEQFTERFGPTEQDYQTVIDFAEQSGFTITARH